jgi:hypothetical protein
VLDDDAQEVHIVQILGGRRAVAQTAIIKLGSTISQTENLGTDLESDIRANHTPVTRGNQETFSAMEV